MNNATNTADITTRIEIIARDCAREAISQGLTYAMHLTREIPALTFEEAAAELGLPRFDSDEVDTFTRAYDEYVTLYAPEGDLAE